MTFQFASTNLVLELGLILWSLLGWRFTLAQFAGGFVMIALLAVVLPSLGKRAWIDAATRHARGEAHGRMEGHAEMDMSVAGDRPFLQRLFSADAFTAICHFFVSDVAMLWKDIAVGLVISGAAAAWVPAGVWASVLLVAFYVAMALAAYTVEIGFGLLHLTPAVHPGGPGAMKVGFAWDYTTWLNLALLVAAAVLAWRFLTTGGPQMLKMME